MSNLVIDKRTIWNLFSDKRSDFLIPDYQRPYAWTIDECKTLWEDLFSFAIPEGDYSKFRNEEYFLGPIVTFKNSDGKLEVIDGQQRLTTLMLLLRAFYTKFGNMKDDESVATKKRIEECVWKTNDFGKPDLSALKINSEVATDSDKTEFLSILKTGEATANNKSAYSINYRFFQEQINDFIAAYPTYFAYLPIRILNYCILLPIEADAQDTALRIFSTLNDRGKPLSDSDIFKAQFYKYFSNNGEKDSFIAKWKDLEALCIKIFHPTYGTPMDELFSRYMYYRRALLGIKSSTTESLRKFYEREQYKILHENQSFDDLCILADFWSDISSQNEDIFSQEVLRDLYVLEYAPNGMWTYFLSVYFMAKRDVDNRLDQEALDAFLKKTIAFVLGYAFTRPGVNALRTPIYAEMVNLVGGKEVNFENWKFDEEQLRTAIDNYEFTNVRALTKSLLTWWALYDSNQQLLSLEKVFEIEHIYAKKRQEIDGGLSSPKLLESLGNKAVLESRINIRASDYRFNDKKKYYLGYTSTGVARKNIEGTCIYELSEMAQHCDDFNEKNILDRYNQIISSFINYVREQQLI